jgi:hypothetical protein
MKFPRHDSVYPPPIVARHKDNFMFTLTQVTHCTIRLKKCIQMKDDNFEDVFNRAVL